MKPLTLIIAALLAAPLWAVVPMPVPEVAPVHRVTVEGFVVVARGWGWAGEQFAVDVEKDLKTQYDLPLARLVFATDRDYREALRNDGFVVEVLGVEVRRGAERFVVVEEIRMLNK